MGDQIIINSLKIFNFFQFLRISKALAVEYEGTKMKGRSLIQMTILRKWIYFITEPERPKNRLSKFPFWDVLKNNKVKLHNKCLVGSANYHFNLLFNMKRKWIPHLVFQNQWLDIFVISHKVGYPISSFHPSLSSPRCALLLGR